MRIRLPQWIHQDELLLLVDWSDLSTRVSDHYQSSYDNNETDNHRTHNDDPRSDHHLPTNLHRNDNYIIHNWFAMFLSRIDYRYTGPLRHPSPHTRLWK